jgi:hypothetical protein
MALVQLETATVVYVRYPTAAPPSAFVPTSVRWLASHRGDVDRARDQQILAALMPEAVRVTAANNRLGWLRANPWN